MRSEKGGKQANTGGKINFPVAVILLVSAAFALSPYSLSFKRQQNRLYPAEAYCAGFDKPVNTESSTDELIQALECADFPFQRRHAARLLGNRGATEAVPHLLKALKDTAEVVQKAAADALSEIGDKTIFEELMANTEDSNPRIRQYSAYVLGRLAKKEDPRVVETLEGISGDKDERVRVDVIWALYKLGSPSSKEIFIQGLNDENPSVRMHSASALGNIKTSESAEALVNSLEKEPDDDVRGALTSALGKHGSKYAVTALLATLPHESDTVRRKIVVRLGEIGTPPAVKTLSNLLTADRSSKVRAEAAKALLKLRDPSTAPALAAALRDRTPSVRIPASNALIYVANTSVMGALIDALDDADSRVANNAAEALIMLGDLDAVHGLIGLLDSPKQFQVELAISVLEEITYKPFGPNPEKWKEWYEKSFRISNPLLDNRERVESGKQNGT